MSIYFFLVFLLLYPYLFWLVAANQKEKEHSYIKLVYENPTKFLKSEKFKVAKSQGFLFLFLNEFQEREFIQKSFTYYSKIRNGLLANIQAANIKEEVRRNWKLFKTRFLDIIFRISPILFDLENLASITDSDEKSDSVTKILDRMNLLQRKIDHVFQIATKALFQVNRKTRTEFDLIFLNTLTEQSMRRRIKALRVFFYFVMTEVLGSHRAHTFLNLKLEIQNNNNTFLLNLLRPVIKPEVLFILKNEMRLGCVTNIKFKRKLDDAIGEQTYRTLRLPLDEWTERNDHKLMMPLYEKFFHIDTIKKFFPKRQKDIQPIFKSFAHDLLPCLHNILNIRLSAFRYLAFFPDKLTVDAPACTKVLRDIKFTYISVPSIDIYPQLIVGASDTNIHHRYWQLHFSQFSQLLLLEWVLYIRYPVKEIEDTSPSLKLGRKSIFSGYYSYLRYLRRQYELQYPLSLETLTTMEI